MSQIEKLITRIRNNPKAVRYEELQRLLKHLGYSRHRQRGSHVMFDHPTLPELTVEKPHGGKVFCHPKRVKRVLRLLDENS